jgi:hypothetical protein
MSGNFGLVTVLFFCGISLGHAAELARSNGHITVDVTVRARPETNAPGITDLPVGTPVRIAPAKVEGWIRIVKPWTGWIPGETFSAVSSEAAARDSSKGQTDQDQESESQRAERRRRHRAAATPLAARSSGMSAQNADPFPEPAPARPAREERSESDLMLAALTATRGETPNAARIARVVTEATIETKRNQEQEKAAVTQSVWKDPFAEDSDPPAVVRPRKWRGARKLALATAIEPVASGDPEANELRAARRELARARAEAANARMDADQARAAAARAQAELAKSGNGTGRDGCAPAVATPRRRSLIGRAGGWREAALDEAGGRSPERVRKPTGFQAPETGRTFVNRVANRTKAAAFTSNRPPIPGAERRSGGTSAVPPPSDAPVPASSVPPPGSAAAVPPAQAAASPANGSWTRGILVVPITPLKRSN